MAPRFISDTGQDAVEKYSLDVINTEIKQLDGKQFILIIM